MLYRLYFIGKKVVLFRQGFSIVVGFYTLFCPDIVLLLRKIQYICKK